MTRPTLESGIAPLTPEQRAARRKQKRAEAWAEAAGAGWKVWLVKIVCLGIIDAMAIYAMFVLLASGNWAVPLIIAIGVIAINVVYLRPGLLPAKYLTPGLIFLFVFQIFVVLYCIYIAFTNYGSGHISTKDDAVNALLIQNQQRVEDSPSYPVSVLEQGGEVLLPHHDSRRRRRDRRRRPPARARRRRRLRRRPRHVAAGLFDARLLAAHRQPEHDRRDGRSGLRRPQRRHTADA